MTMTLTKDVLADSRRAGACVGQERGLREGENLAQEPEGPSLHTRHRTECNAWRAIQEVAHDTRN